MDKQAYDPKQLYETLISVVNNVQLSEIAVSPYILPAEESTARPQASSSTSTLPLNELISSSIRPFSLIEGDKLVLPQKPLYAIYGYAVKALSRYPRDVLHSTPLYSFNSEDGEGNHSNDIISQIDDLTKCILIQTPEHGRAMNLRKRLLLIRLSKFKDSSSPKQQHDMIHAELHWTELILGIAANAKMAPLWHHRKWLYSLMHSLNAEDTVLEKKGQRSLDMHLKGRRLLRIDPVRLTEEEYEKELSLVEVCAERYPRNYQAWSYRYWLIKGQVIPSSSSSSSSSCSAHEAQAGTSDSRNRRGGIAVLGREYEKIEKHLSTHITDHTAATHLLDIIELSAQLSRSEDLSSSLANKSWNFALDFVSRYPYKETPWLLLRGVLAILKAQAAVALAPEGMHYQTSLQEALSLANKLTNARAAEGETGTVGKECQVNINEREQIQKLSSVKYATRSLFYLSCRSAEIPGRPSLGSADARELLKQFR